MFAFRLLSNPCRHPRQFPPRAFDLAHGLLLLRPAHLRQRFVEPPVGALQNRHRHFQVARHLFHRRRHGGQRLPLGFEKQFRLGENALAGCARAFAPGGVQLPGLARIATVGDQSGRHALAMFRIHPRHRHQILHGYLRRDLAFPHLLLDALRQ
jgi:hypothetical protein